MGDSSGGIKIGPLDISGLPPWCKTGAGVVALLIALGMGLIYVWNHGGREILREEVAMSKLEAAQLIESNYHIADEPLSELPIDDGAGIMRHYDLHDCTSTTWVLANGRKRTTFALHPEREKDMDIATELEILGLSQVAVSSAGFIGEDCSNPGPGCCLHPHPPPWDESDAEPLTPCTVRIWRYFEPDSEVGCVHHQDYNHCLGVWLDVVWEACYH